MDTSTPIEQRTLTMADLAYPAPASVIVDAAAPRSGQTVSGYGGRIPTRYRIAIVGPRGRVRWHRVRMMQYGNAGSAYVVRAGVVWYMDPYVEQALTDARDAAAGVTP